MDKAKVLEAELQRVNQRLERIEKKLDWKAYGKWLLATKQRDKQEA